MDSPKERHFNNPENQPPSSQQSSPSGLIRNLLSAIQAPQGLQSPLLKRVYCLLVHLASYSPTCYPNAGADVTFCDIKIGWCGIRVPFEDIFCLSDILFQELYEMFMWFLSTLYDVSANHALGRTILHLDIQVTAEQLNLLLRCCLVMLNLLVHDQSRLLKKGQVLSMLRELCSLNLIQGNEESTINFEKVSRAYTFDDNDCTTSLSEDIVASLHFMEPVDPCLPFLCALLEVFADELLVHGQLRECFKLIDSHSSTSRKLFMCPPSHGDIGNVIEVVSTHFWVSFCDGQAFENFPNRLISMQGKDFRAPELSLTGSLVLLLNPFMLSAPKFLLAHLISLVSRTIAIGTGLENTRPDVRLMDCYLSTFERSVILYLKHRFMDYYPTGGEYDDSVLRFNKNRENSQPSFQFYIQPRTRTKINNIISKLDNSWQSRLHNMCMRTKSDLATSCIVYMKESKHILNISFRDEIISILSCIISKAFSYEVDDSLLCVGGDKSPQDMYLLAAILKLMSCSLLQSIWCLMGNGNMGRLMTLKDFSSCKEYESIVRIISCFQQFNTCLPIQKSLSGIIETHPAQHQESKLMLLHFSGLLALSFSTGLDFLVKGCILTMMSLMNLFVFEEGNLDALGFDNKSGSFSSVLYPDNAIVDKKSSFIIASKFQKIQTLHLSRPSIVNDCIGREDGLMETSTNSSVSKKMQYVVGIEEEEMEETCNGKIFLKCLLQNREKISDLDDLADFIECKRGKDYSDWLKGRQRYRKWKCGKMAVLRWEKKKKTWKFMSGKRT